MSAPVHPVHTALADLTAIVADRAEALDTGRLDVRDDLARFGAAGLFEAALRDDGLPELVSVIEHTAAASLAVGFSLWAHTMAVTYLAHAPEPAREGRLEALSSGSRAGVTAMAAGLKQVAGLGPVPLVADSSGDHLWITGPIHWASNVFDDSLIVLPARRPDGTTLVAVVDADLPGITVNPAPDLMALGATASTSLRLHEVPVSPEQILTDDLASFVSTIRPTFLLLQTAFCVGVAAAARAGAEQATGQLAEQFDTERTELGQQLHRLRDKLFALARNPQAAGLAEIIRLRLDAATTAVDATRLESTLAGGAGYATRSAANRRFREAAFLPIQSPSEGQLRWELSRYV
ncbi:acyl-CoA dehydrogenase [Mycolicibacter heraklionensis]|uniref:Acyl-CoA dehydrogenase n=1 Tax=Mycolicibacter heraklionensis TaxID=512402 RepID=A0AA91IZA2_9MYCO|nr:acyl-CoA dehydrogenase family protein [Mycolicibacter heraklionensis]OBK87944.1 acyl-CoA dehydrogenase [Mycolicibacter heraklionensis]